jgi:hypothetical protein
MKCFGEEGRKGKLKGDLNVDIYWAIIEGYEMGLQ